jgi:hypothetical protein
MGVVIINNAPTKKQLEIAKKDYGDFIKVTVDIKREIAAIGGEWHADGEEELIRAGSQQKDIWGGGIDIKTGEISASALINLRPKQENGSQEILNPKIKKSFTRIVKKVFNDFV